MQEAMSAAKPKKKKKSATNLTHCEHITQENLFNIFHYSQEHLILTNSTVW